MGRMCIKCRAQTRMRCSVCTACTTFQEQACSIGFRSRRNGKAAVPLNGLIVMQMLAKHEDDMHIYTSWT